MSDNLKFHELAVRKDELQKKLLSIMSSQNSENAKKLEASLNSQVSEEKLKIAFVGQHNSGKSTIISALTGNRQIKISNNVETDTPEDYAWEGVILTDTPGLYAGKKEEHDILSLQKIKESDLLMFCITSSLFDDLLIRKFVELAYQQAYKSKIFIVVNKMSQECGEFDQLVYNYKDTLVKTLAKENGDFNDFPVCFIDARDYIDGKKDKEEDLIEYSNFRTFINSMNNYISSKKLFAKLDTPCRLMIGTIDDEISDTAVEVDKNFMSILRQSSDVIQKYKRDSRRYINDINSQLRSKIMSKANGIIPRIGEENINEYEIETINNEIKALTEEISCELQEYVTNIHNKTIEEIGEILNSDMGNFVIQQFTTNEIIVNSEFDSSFSDFVEKYNSISGVIKKTASGVVDLAGGAGNLAKVSMVSGSQLHSVVLNVGHFFGASFKPWQAVNIASKIGKVASYLGPILNGISTVLDIGQKVKEDDRIRKIQNAKKETYNQFSSIASDIEEGIKEQFRLCEAEIFDMKNKEIENMRTMLVSNNKNNSDYVKNLKSLRSNIYNLIEDIAKG